METFTLPLKLTCRISGKIVTYTSADYVNKRLEKYGGDLQAMLSDFVCRDAKRNVKDNMSLAEIRIESGVAFIAENGAEITIGQSLMDEIKGPPTIKYDFKVGKPEPITKLTAPTDSCFNPGWYIEQKSCLTCAFASICNFSRKRLVA